MVCPKCGAALGEGDVVCPACGEKIENKEGTPESERVVLSELYPMKWYKFLVNFMLFAAAILNVLDAVLYMTGSIYPDAEIDMGKLLYTAYPAMKALDVMYGVFLLFFAAFCIFLRFQLSGFKKKAPFYLYLMYGIEGGFAVLYSLLVLLVIGEIPPDASIVSTIITTGLIIWANYTYFKKRESLFVN